MACSPTLHLLSIIEGWPKWQRSSPDKMELALHSSDSPAWSGLSPTAAAGTLLKMWIPSPTQPCWIRKCGWRANKPSRWISACSSLKATDEGLSGKAPWASLTCTYLQRCCFVHVKPVPKNNNNHVWALGHVTNIQEPFKNSNIPVLFCCLVFWGFFLL